VIDNPEQLSLLNENHHPLHLKKQKKLAISEKKGLKIITTV
jgi:hypothetical protein